MTKEVDCLIAANASGNTGCYAGYTTNGQHTVGSYHERTGTPSGSGPIGLAVDFDAYNNATKLRACADLFLTYSHQLAELFYTPLGYGIKNGARCANVAGHSDHVHVAVPLGTFLTPLTKEQAMTLVIEPVGAISRGNDADGWAFGRRGHVYAYGAAQHHGGWDDATRNDQNRLCVALVPTLSGNGYWLVSNRGETYAYGDAQGVGNYQAKWGAGQIIGAVLNHHTANGGVTLLRDNGTAINIYGLPA